MSTTPTDPHVPPVEPYVSPPVPVGLTSKVGYGATIASAIGLVLVLVLDVDEEQAAIIASAIAATVSLAVTQLGRFAQAKAYIDKQPPVA
jgi:hypothetical protein